MHTNRQDAHKAGDTFYSTGRPCNNGHITQRYVSTGGCTQCLSEARRKFAKAGVVKFVTILIHPDDIAAHKALSDSLQIARDLAAMNNHPGYASKTDYDAAMIEAARRRDDNANRIATSL